MVEQINNYAPVAPNKQEPTRPAAPASVNERDRNAARSNRDTVSISQEAQELLAEDGHAEGTRDAVEAQRASVREREVTDDYEKEKRAEIQVHRDGVKAAREESTEKIAERRRAETDRIRDDRNEASAQSADDENDSTRA